MVKLRFGCTFMLIRCAQITMCEVTIGRCVARSALRSRLGLPDGRQHPRLTHTPPDREEPGMARAEAGKLASRRQRRRGRCRLRQPKRQPEVSRGCRGSILQMLKPPDREEPGMARAEAGNLCASRATPSRPAGHPVAKSPAPSMPHPANQSGTVSVRPVHPALALGAS